MSTPYSNNGLLEKTSRKFWFVYFPYKPSSFTPVLFYLIYSQKRIRKITEDDFWSYLIFMFELLWHFYYLQIYCFPPALVFAAAWKNVFAINCCHNKSNTTVMTYDLTHQFYLDLSNWRLTTSKTVPFGSIRNSSLFSEASTVCLTATPPPRIGHVLVVRRIRKS